MAESLSMLLSAVFCVAVFWSCWSLSRGLSRPLLWILGAGVFTRIIYLCSSRPWDQANDWGQHIAVVHSILEKNFIPQAADCYECSHPPLYHMMLAPFVDTFVEFGVGKDWGLQWVTLGIFLVGMFAMVRTLSVLLPNPRIAPWAAALLVFWPRGIPFSVTINNDIGVFTFGALTFLALLSGRLRGVAAGMVALVLSKTSALLLFPPIVLYHAWKSRSTLGFKKYVNPVNIGVAAAFVTAVTFALYNRHIDQGNVVIGNYGAVGPEFQLGNGGDNFLCFELSNFVSYADIGYKTDIKGRQCYWNFFLKTMLVTEQDVGEPLHQKWGSWMSGVFLSLLALVGFGAIACWRKSRDTFILCFTMIVVSLAGSLWVRWNVPTTATGDFRFVFNSVFALVVFIAYGMNEFKARAGSTLSRTLVATFVLVSAFYYLVPMRR